MVSLRILRVHIRWMSWKWLTRAAQQEMTCRAELAYRSVTWTPRPDVLYLSSPFFEGKVTVVGIGMQLELSSP